MEEKGKRTKEEYQKFVQKVLDEWGTKLDAVDQKVVKPSVEHEAGHFKELNELRTRRQEIVMKLDELKASTQDWEKSSKELDASLEELKLAFERAESAIK